MRKERDSPVDRRLPWTGTPWSAYYTPVPVNCCYLGCSYIRYVLFLPWSPRQVSSQYHSPRLPLLALPCLIAGRRNSSITIDPAGLSAPLDCAGSASFDLLVTFPRTHHPQALTPTPIPADHLTVCQTNVIIPSLPGSSE